MKKNSKNNPAESNAMNSPQATPTKEIRISTMPRVVYFVLFALVVTACTTQDTVHEHDTYTCPMHPTVISDRPGSCPVCGMDLVRKARAGEEIKMTDKLARLIKSPNETVISSIKTIKGEFKSMPISVNAQGMVTYDTRNIYTIPARVDGRLEKIYLKYAFQPVAKGQKIAEIYSPELIAAQRELILLLENDPNNRPLIDAAKSKLQLRGLSEADVAELVKNKTASTTFSIYSPYSGYVVTDQSQPTSSTTNAGGMPGSMSAPSVDSGLTPTSSEQKTVPMLREGNYVTAGQTLFRIVNTSTTRVELDIPVSQTVGLEKGTQLVLDFGNGATANAAVDFVQPFFNDGQDFMKVRVNVSDPLLHIGHLVNTKISLPALEAIWVPREAVLDLGIDKIVFLKNHGTFKARKVTTGATSNGLVEIKAGLSSSDDIAANAQYMVDSDSFIKITD